MFDYKSVLGVRNNSEPHKRYIAPHIQTQKQKQKRKKDYFHPWSNSFKKRRKDRILRVLDRITYGMHGPRVCFSWSNKTHFGVAGLSLLSTPQNFATSRILCSHGIGWGVTTHSSSPPLQQVHSHHFLHSIHYFLLFPFISTRYVMKEKGVKLATSPTTSTWYDTVRYIYTWYIYNY